MHFDLVLSKMKNSCSRREYCEADIINKLKSFDLTESEKVTIIKSLKDEAYIDNLRFCKAYVNDKFKFNRWGKKKIFISLKSKGIDEGDINSELNKIDAQEYLNVIEELLKSKKVKAKNEFEKKGKLTNYALSKGFEYDLINKVIEKLGL